MNKIFKTFWWWLVIIAVVLGVVVIGGDVQKLIFAEAEITIIASPVKDEGDAYKATVKIIVPIFDEEKKEIYEGNGTGWVAEIIKIGTEKIAIIVTNSHVVASLVSGDHPELVKEPRAVVFYDENRKKIGSYPFGILWHSDPPKRLYFKRQDIAVLGVVIPDELILPVYHIEDEFPEKGEEVTSIGFPSDSPKPIKKEFKITTSGGGKKSFDGCSFSGEAGPGQSGSPVYNNEFKVIGMIWGYVDYNLFFFKKRINYLVPIDELQSYIDSALTAAETFNFKLIKNVPIAQNPRE